MKLRTSNPFFLLASFMACSGVALTTGCASGGFKLTRQYADFVNRQEIIIRIILYFFTSIVFMATLLIDMVIFNTVDFWQGKVSQGTYEFHKGDKTFVVRHEVLPGSGLKRSTIRVLASNKSLLQEVVLRETASGEIEMSVDGKLRARVRDIDSIPVAAIFDASEKLQKESALLFEAPLNAVAALARNGFGCDIPKPL